MFENQLPKELASLIGKTIERKLPNGQVIKFVLGDVTGDGKIDQDDIEILKLLIKEDSTSDALFASMTNEQIAACDVTGDGYINMDDLVQMMRKIVLKPENTTDDKLNSLKSKMRR